jgi:hypothetical protein
MRSTGSDKKSSSRDIGRDTVTLHNDHHSSGRGGNGDKLMWNNGGRMTRKENRKELEENFVAVTICPPRISHEVTGD